MAKVPFVGQYLSKEFHANATGFPPGEKLGDISSQAMRAAWRLDAKGGMARLKKLGGMVGTRLSFCRRQLDRRVGRVFHDQPAGCASLAASLFGHHQRYRESPCRRPYADAESLPLA